MDELGEAAQSACESLRERGSRSFEFHKRQRPGAGPWAMPCSVRTPVLDVGFMLDFSFGMRGNDAKMEGSPPSRTCRIC